MKIIFTLFLLITIGGPYALAQSAPHKPAPAVSSVIAADSSVVREINVEEMKKLVARKGQPLLINFWATWCEPCRAEFPDLVQIDKEYRGRGLEMITFSLDDIADIKTTVPQFLAEMKASHIPAYLLNVSDPGEAVSAIDPEWNGALPTTFIFDSHGQITYKHTGRIKPDAVREAIGKVIAKP